MILYLGKFEVSVKGQVEWEEWGGRTGHHSGDAMFLSASVTFCLKYFKTFPWSLGESLNSLILPAYFFNDTSVVYFFFHALYHKNHLHFIFVAMLTKCGLLFCLSVFLNSLPSTLNYFSLKVFPSFSVFSAQLTISYTEKNLLPANFLRYYLAKTQRHRL